MKRWARTALLFAVSSACSGRTFRTSDAADDPVLRPADSAPRASASAPVADPRETAPNDAADSIDAHHAPPSTTSSSGVESTPE